MKDDFSPQCQIDECRLCPGNGVKVYAPGKRKAFELPVFTYRCAHRCHWSANARTRLREQTR